MQKKKHKKSILPAILIVLAAAVLIVCVYKSGIVQSLLGQDGAAPVPSGSTNVTPAAPQGQPSTEENTNTNENNIVLTETKEADRSYINETLFLGDSNTAKYLDYLDDDGMPYCTTDNTIGVISMGIEHITTLPCMSFSTGLYTMPDAVSILQPRRMIIMFGTNNLDYGDQGAKAFADYYTEQIKAIQNAYPDADIIINSILPATATTVFYNAQMNRIRLFNQEILRICTENGWKFLNSFEAFVDDTGYADPALYEPDGLHLNRDGVDTMFRYIRTHALYTKDRRTMPLKEIPAVNGPLVNILLPAPAAE